ncbi:MAG TPA: sugar phosphate nucleotidyltransferase [Thermoanaerobaculia bacterium]|nr:sugar phosphate nucleotidyltransferase [Thermoanaerobaculia bacterium]
MKSVVTAILGGGQGSRLWPLTKNRAKPAVPVGGKFRLIDVPISNSLHADVRRIFVLTQFNSASLHQHISQTYRFDSFSRGFVNILAATQSLENRDWYQGTADAVRQNLERLLHQRPAEILILSGDQLYLMDLRSFVLEHRRHRADLSVAVKAVARDQARGLGIMRVNHQGRIVEFVEKPSDDSVLDRLAADEATLRRLGFDPADGPFLASMGIYTFRPEVLREVLEGTDDHDFGKEVIPKGIHGYRVYAFAYGGYWRDIGTIGSFHQANLELALPVPPLNLYSPDKPIFTHPRFLPGVKINQCHVQHAVICDGSIITGAGISWSIVGVRSVIRSGTEIRHSVVMGANFFEPEEHAPAVPLGIGHDCVIENAILDRDVRIGNRVRLVNSAGARDVDGDPWAIRDGIIVVPAGSIIPDGTEV